MTACDIYIFFSSFFFLNLPRIDDQREEKRRDVLIIGMKELMHEAMGVTKFNPGLHVARLAPSIHKDIIKILLYIREYIIYYDICVL